MSGGYKGSVETFQHDIFQPFAHDMHGEYDSVTLCYPFRCLPCSFPQNATDVFANVAPALVLDGVVFRSTMLGKGVVHNWLGSYLIGLYNKKGVFGNVEDSGRD